ncbi:hypothetical protein FRACYDRAFT_250784 [Fragilariopsis cylindrus CCMP1102]|uniref:Uncharacterized protein n=1 Tax=Fragilariopsis cylindrus CCMP1102 TaxID=635003 RepID=A0A1E7EP66_9STRA|nr:hypothetical protein FRACYDRAFT_250784 [Fragilariopsis cylindrus CCMP1102]|eukprot:OEU07758.1 hypothetical protein FRACYDRAFT_250784 [Fragilariopsis cylindrus CCMP1102]
MTTIPKEQQQRAEIRARGERTIRGKDEGSSSSRRRRRRRHQRSSSSRSPLLLTTSIKYWLYARFSYVFHSCTPIHRKCHNKLSDQAMHLLHSLVCYPKANPSSPSSVSLHARAICLESFYPGFKRSLVDRGQQQELDLKNKKLMKTNKSDQIKKNKKERGFSNKKMTSYASYMPSSPGIIYPSPGNNDAHHKQKKEQQAQEKSASVHKENMRLKSRLTIVQNEYEELRDESNYQRAKVSELSDQIASSTKQKQMSTSSFSVSNFYNNNSGSGGGVTSSNNTNECGASTVHNRLIDTSLQNAELNLTIDKLKIQVRQTEMKMEELQKQKRSNNKLLLEMSDVVRALNSVHIDYEYDASSANKKDGIDQHVNAQQSSIKKIKLKVEAIMEDRALLVRRCKELEEETFNQQQQIKVLEAQFHIMNTTNIYKGVALGDDAATTHTAHTAHTTVTSTTTTNATGNTIVGISAPNSPNSVYSFAAQSTVSNMTPIRMQHDAIEVQLEEENSTMMSACNSPQTQRSPAAEYVRQSKELARYKQHEEEQLKELTELKQLKDIQIDTIRRLRLENERITKRMQSLQHELTSSKEEKQDSIIKRDEYKDNLHDIVVHYKQLNTEHMSTQKQLESLQSYVNKLEIDLQKTKDERQQKHHQAEEEEEKECNTHEVQEEEEEEEEVLDDESSVRTEDLVVAYNRAMKKINILETNLLSVHGLSKNNRDQKNYCDTINRYKKFEMERNDFQRKLNKALEETRLAKMETKNVREEAKHARKQLTSFLQKNKNKNDYDNNNNNNNKLPSSFLPLPTSSTTSTMGMKQKQEQNKVAPFKPLSIQELMEKDFAEAEAEA